MAHEFFERTVRITIIYSYLMNLPIDILITLILSLYKHNLVAICYMVSLYQFLRLHENENSTN